MLASPVIARVVPRSRCTSRPSLPAKFRPLPVSSSPCAFNWSTFTASVPSVPAVTPVILPEPSALMVTLPNFGASAICRPIAPVRGSVTVFRLAPE
ncbi:hypothetical protein FQZ97_563570 [compost metagenome]